MAEDTAHPRQRAMVSLWSASTILVLLAGINLTPASAQDNTTGTDAVTTMMTTVSFDTTEGQTTAQTAPPQPDCPMNITIRRGPGETFSGPVIWTFPGSNTDTDLFPLVSSLANGTSLPLGEHLNDVWPTGFPDINCTFTISVSGPTPLTCPNDMVVGTDPALDTALVTWNISDANQFLEEFPITSSAANNSTFDLGTTIVRVWRSEYPEVNCSFSVTVEDRQPPVFPVALRPPAHLVLSSSTRPTWSISAQDNTGSVTLSSTHTPSDYFPVGNTTVTYTATDANGLTTTYTFVVTIVDDGSPLISNCPADISVEAAVGQATSPVTWTPPTATGTGVITTTNDFSPGDAFIIGTTRVTYTFTDEQGNSSECFFRVTVTAPADVTSPTTTTPCPENIVIVVPPGTVNVPAYWTEPVFADENPNAVVPEVQRSSSPGSLFKPGITEVIYIGFDSNYNRQTCRFTVNISVVNDTTPPVFDTCPTDILKWVPLHALGMSSTPVTWTVPMATDNYPGLTVSASDDSGDTFGFNTDTLVEYTAVDISGNVATCSFNVSVRVDTERPMVTCPQDVVRYVTSDVTSMVITWPAPEATDNSGAPAVTVSPPSGSVFQASPAGQNDLVTVTASDGFGNNATCTFSVNVLTDGRPFLTCPDVILDTLPGQPYADVTWPNVVITDDLTPEADLEFFSTHTAPIRRNYDDPALTISITATDASGSNGTCTFTAIVQDRERPVWTNCPTDITIAATPRSNSADVTWDPPSVSDNDGLDPTVTDRPGEVTQHFSSGQAWPIRYAARDSSGNEGVCEFTVTVTVDTSVPVFTYCPASPVNVNALAGTASALVSWLEPTVSADEGPVTIRSNFMNGRSFPIGSYNVVYQAVDETGNIGYCQFTVNVIDIENPAFINCPNINPPTVYVYSPSQTVPVTWTAPTATDNSGVVDVVLATGSPSSGSRFGVATHTITYVARDGSGNMVTTCQFTFTVAEKPPDQTLQLRGQLTMATVRGLTASSTDSLRLSSLENDLNDYFRQSTDIAADFLYIQLTSTQPDGSSNLEIQYSMYLCKPAHYNKATIEGAFESALINSNAFPTSNTIVADSFSLNVREFNGSFTLRSIVPNAATEVDFSACCTNPNSLTYVALETRVNAFLEAAFGDMAGYRMAKALQFRPGSVVVPFTVTFDGSATSTFNDITSTFDGTVTPGSSELNAGTDLYLVQALPYVNVQEVCPASYCLNGGTCTIVNPTTTYDYVCTSCADGFSGDRCELGESTPTSPGTTLSTGAIVGIVLGAVGFLLLMLLMCCCCWLLLANADPYRHKRPVEYGHHYPMVMMEPPRDNRYPDRRPIVDRPGPIITELEERMDNPMLYHPGIDRRPPQPVPLITQPPISRPVSLGPSFIHEYEDEIVQPQPQHYRQPPPQSRPRPRPRDYGRMDRLRAIMPEHLRRSSSGPRFHGNDQPEPVGEMKRRMFQEFNY